MTMEITISNIKQYFPLNEVEIFHKDLGYAIPLDKIPATIKNAELINFASINDVIVAYAQG